MHLRAPGAARAKSGGGRKQIWHADRKFAEGVDLVGDVFEPAFQARLHEIKPRCVLVCNFLEHVIDRKPLCDLVLRLVPAGGYICVSGPHDYPYHEDPIDTMFRPTIDELAAHFPGTEIIDSAIIDSGNWNQWSIAERGRTLPRTLMRLMVPFYRPRKWLELARQSPWIFRHITAFAVVLRKAP